MNCIHRKNNLMGKLLSNKFLFGVLVLGLIVLYYIPILSDGNPYWIIHDFIEEVFVRYKVFSDSHSYWEMYSGEAVLEGFDTSNIITSTIYYFIPSIIGIILNDIIVRMIAFCGVFMLVRNLHCDKSNIIAFITAIVFAYIPFYSNYGLSSAGIPLLLWSFHNLYYKERIIISYIVIIFFALFSQLVLSGWTICIILALIILIVSIREKRFSKELFIGLVFLSATYLITNMPLLLYYFNNSGVISHRTEFAQNESILSIIKNSSLLFFRTQYHTGTMFTLPIAIISLVLILNRNNNMELKELKVLFILICAIVLWFSFIHLCNTKLSVPSICKQFQFDRFYFLLPTLWILLLAFSMGTIWRTLKGRIISVAVCFLIFCGNGLMNKEYTFLAKKYVLHKQTEPTYRQFFDEELFAQIDSYIAKPKNNYKVASIGMYPSVAQYNGFNCIDGYWNTYPLEYKHEFRKIIAEELEKNEQIKSYFDNWGSRCYVFSSELGQKYLYDKNCGMEIQSLAVNTQQMLDMNCQYVFSAVPVLNYEELGWKFEKSFTTNDSWWNIYLYKLSDVPVVR